MILILANLAALRELMSLEKRNKTSINILRFQFVLIINFVVIMFDSGDTERAELYYRADCYAFVVLNVIIHF